LNSAVRPALAATIASTMGQRSLPTPRPRRASARRVDGEAAEGEAAEIRNVGFPKNLTIPRLSPSKTSTRTSPMRDRTRCDLDSQLDFSRNQDSGATSAATSASPSVLPPANAAGDALHCGPVSCDEAGGGRIEQSDELPPVGGLLVA
jgi:hypothetical protein